MSKDYISILIMVNLVKIVHLRSRPLDAPCTHDLPQGVGGSAWFSQEINKCPLKHYEMWNQGHFKH